MKGLSSMTVLSLNQTMMQIKNKKIYTSKGNEKNMA